MKEFGIEEQKLIIDKYKVNHRRRFLWHRIISVLSAIVVFCATYSLLLPAFTMEDPTVGIKLSNQYTYENENLSAVFTVTGRAIFKEENIDIENPQADLVDLNVIVLDKEDRVYEQYAEYASDSIGEEDLANIMAFELKFTYMGHELDMRKCDIVAEINAKEIFFTDEFGTEYDGSVYVADPSHPMATPEKEASSAMAFTAIQGTSMNIGDAPTVYTTDIEEVSTLTVDVKGETLALLTSATSNPTFTVQYYAMITRIDTEPENTNGLTPLEVIDTRNGVRTPTSSQTLASLTNKTNIYLESVTGISNKTHSVVTKPKLTKLYKEKTYTFAEAPGYEYVDRLAENGNYKLRQIRQLAGTDPESINLDDWNIYQAAKKPSFTNNKDLANSTNKIYIEEGSVIRMVYIDSGVNQLFDDEVTMFDYDITDGRYTTYGGAVEKTSQQKNTNIVYTNTLKQGINNFSTSATGALTFGSANTKTGFYDARWNNIYINRDTAFGMVTGVNENDGDFVPIFAEGINAPDLFSSVNEHEPTNATYSLFDDALVADYDAVNIDKNTTLWKDLTGNDTEGIQVVADDKNYFTGEAYTTSGNKFYLPPSITNSYINEKTNFTIELEFGNIRNAAGTTPILLSTENGENLLKLSIDKSGNLCLYRDSNIVFQIPNGLDLVSYSTIAIVHANKGTTTYLRMFCDGVMIGDTTAANFKLETGNRLCFGGFDSSNNTKQIVEYKSIRIHKHSLGQGRVRENARYNETRAAVAGVETADTYTAGGKTVIGGRTIEFKRNGDTYTLTAIKNSNSNAAGANLENLEYFNKWITPKWKATDPDVPVWTNDFWPMDLAGTYGADGHDIKFGSSSYWNTRRFYGEDPLSDAKRYDTTGTPSQDKLSQWGTNAYPRSDDSKDHNSYFGMKYKVDFSIEEDYAGPLEYFFYGDDDLWVFLDDTLVCDIGGVHASVGQIVDLWDYLPGEGYEGDHTLYMFYLERGASGSSCYMQFTLPSASVNTPQQATTSLSLEKVLNNSTTTAEFEFEVELFDENDTLLTDVYSYSIFDSNGLETGETGAISAGKGTVILKGGEKIVIQFLPVSTKYKITENDDFFFTTYSVNGETAVEGKQTEGTLDAPASVVFINTSGNELPSTGVLGGGMSVIIYYIPLGIATVYMCAMPIINRPKKTKNNKGN